MLKMYLTQPKSSTGISKSLTFSEPLVTPMAAPASLPNDSTTDHTKAIAFTTPQAQIGSINIYTDPKTSTDYVHTMSDTFVIKGLDDSNALTISNGDISVNKNINAIDGNFVGDITAYNANLLGDLVCTTGVITNDLNVGGTTKMGLASTQQLNSDIVHTNYINVQNLFHSQEIHTNAIGSDPECDLAIAAGPNCAVSIPNIRYNVLVGAPIIDSIMIKSTKVFLVNTNTILQADESCDGIEIIIYNRNPTGLVVIRDQFNIVERIAGRCAIKLVYILLAATWVKI